MVSRPLPNDIPTRSVRGSRASIAAVDPNNSHTVWVSFKGSRGLPEPAYYPGQGALQVGQDVRVTAEPELRRWAVSTEANEYGATISLEKIWQLNTDTDAHNHIAIHPTQPWIATVRRSGTARTLEIYNWQTEALVDSLALATSLGVYDLKWCSNGDHLAMATDTTPFINIFPVDAVTGDISAAVSDPATAAPAEGDTVVWHPRHIAVYINNTSGGAHPVSGWPFVTSFGAKYAAPTDVAGWGAGNSSAGIWVDVAGYTRVSAITAIKGLSITPDGSSLVMRGVDGAWAWLLQYQLTSTGAFWHRYDSIYKLVNADSNSGPATAWPEFDETGTVVVWGNVNGVSHGSNAHGAEAYACEFSQFGFGHLNGSPYGTNLMSLGGSILHASRGPKWRPGRRQVMLPTDGQITSSDPKLSLFDMDGARFTTRTDWIPSGDAFDWWLALGGVGDMSADFIRTAWSPDGAYFFMGLGSSQLANLTDAIAVFRVN